MPCKAIWLACDFFRYDSIMNIFESFALFIDDFSFSTIDKTVDVFILSVTVDIKRPSRIVSIVPKKEYHM